MMKLLTAIITFRNEGDEVEVTLNELERTAGGKIDIILINDASNDGYNYYPLVQKYSNISYHINPQRLGSSGGKQLGTALCETPFFIMLDAHIRFYDTDWREKITDRLSRNPNSLYCCRCVPWDNDTKKETGSFHGLGACIEYFNIENRTILDIKWITQENKKNNDDIIPCIMGGCYASSIEYWNKIKGFEGLKLYSCEEQYVSLKAWMEGGGCRIIDDVWIGHLFRNKFPYEIKSTEFFYNKLVIAETLMPKEIKDVITDKLKRLDYGEYVRSKELIKKNHRHIASLRKYYTENLNMGFNKFKEINDSYLNS